MDILGIGFPELVLLFIIVLLVMGPEDMQKTARTIGRWLADLRRSDVWRSLVQLRRETQRALYQVEREVNLEENLREVERSLEKELRQAVTFKPLESSAEASKAEADEPAQGKASATATAEASVVEEAPPSPSRSGPDTPVAEDEPASPPAEEAL